MRVSPDTQSTFGDRNAANPARVIIGKSKIALIGHPTIPVVVNSGAEVSMWLNNHQHLVIVLQLDIATASRRAKVRLLFKHLREVQLHLGIVLDHAAKFLDHRMKGGFLLLGFINDLFQRVIEAFRL